jgi:hypothetical protein
VRNDWDRCTLLRKFIEILEKYDTEIDGHMKRCVSAVNIQPYTDAISRRTVHKGKIFLIVFRCSSKMQEEKRIGPHAASANNSSSRISGNVQNTNFYRFEFTALPVGAGDAFFIRRGRMSALIDGGRSIEGFCDLFKQVTRRNSVKVVVCTHNDSDHVNGIIGFMRGGLRCDEIWLPGTWSYRINDLSADPINFARELWKDVSEMAISDDESRSTNLRWEILARRARQTVQTNVFDTQPESEDEAIQMSEDYDVFDSYISDILLSYVLRFPTILAEKLQCQLRPKPDNLALFFEAIVAASRIRQIAQLANDRGIRIRWYEYGNSAESDGGVQNFLTPVNSREIRIRRIKELSALYYLSLTVSNRESLVFNSPGQNGDPGILFTADSDLSFCQQINWHDGMIVTAPHHGSEHNSGAYLRFNKDTQGKFSINWVRSDGRYKSRPGTAFLALNGSKWCTLCRNHAKPKQSVRFVRLGKVWVPRATRKCRCK